MQAAELRLFDGNPRRGNVDLIAKSLAASGQVPADRGERWNAHRAGGVVFDPFGGSGSTLIAAHGRQGRCFTVELDPRYADVILRRFEAHTGTTPTLDGEPVSFLDVAAA
jgi:hypothetical protein